MRGTRVLIGMAAVLFSGSAAVHAQDQDPSARVARTSFLQGDVSFRPGTVDDWTSATLNYPLTSGDHLWTDTDARAELHVGANAIRLAPQTAFEILDLDDNHLQIRLTQGSALITVRTLDVDDDMEIDTPTGAVTILRDGTCSRRRHARTWLRRRGRWGASRCSYGVRRDWHYAPSASRATPISSRVV